MKRYYDDDDHDYYYYYYYAPVTVKSVTKAFQTCFPSLIRMMVTAS